MKTEPPAALSHIPTPPRRARVSAYVGPTNGLLIVVGALWWVIGWGILGGLVLSDAPVWDDIVLAVRGAPATATFVSVLPTESSLRKHPVMEVRFRFLDRNGVVRFGSSRTADEELLRKLRKASTAALHYDPGNPRNARIDGTRRSPFGLFALAPLCFGAGGTVLLLLGLGGAVRRRRIYVHGSLALGRMVSVTERRLRVGGDRLLRIRYTFPGPRGEVEGTMADTEAPPEDADVPVLYDPKDPRRSLIPRTDGFE